MSSVCSSTSCYLIRRGGVITWPLITIAGLVDGFNPCAIGMILLLLGYIVVFACQSEKIIKLGGAYIATVYLTYLFLGLLFYHSIEILNFSSYRSAFDRLLGGLLLGAGLINIKDFWAPGRGLSLGIPQKARLSLLRLVERVSLPATIILAILVTLLETPCSLPIYLGTATLLNHSKFAWPVVLAYFLYYNFLFVLPLIVILFLVWRGRKIFTLKDWEHKARRWMKLTLGLFLVLMGGWLFFKL